MSVINFRGPSCLILLAVVAVAGCAIGVPYWPPAVSSKTEIESLPTSQRDLRGIGIGDQELQVIADRFPQLDYLFFNAESRVSDQGVAWLAKATNLYEVVIENGERVSVSPGRSAPADFRKDGRGRTG
jgi:hypothetical protein